MKNLLFALGAGYLLGILFAPREGKTLRADIKRHFEDLQIEAEIKGIELKESVSDTINKSSEHISNAGKKATEAFTQLDKNVHDIIKTA